MEFFTPGYLGLFIISFLAATILPMGSEPFFVAMLVGGFPVVATVLWATAGNTLGAYTGYWLGYWGNWDKVKKYTGITETQALKWQKYINKYGPITGVMAWLPFVGDPLTVALGFFKVPWRSTAFWIALGKFMRYVLWALPFWVWK